jgi:TPR repeat protein
MALITLYTTADYSGAGARPFQYYLDYTGAELLRAAMYQLGMRDDNRYRILYRDASNQRWLSSSRKLAEQSLMENMYIIVMIPSLPTPPAGPGAGGAAPAPAYVAHGDTMYLPVSSSYAQNIQRPQGDIDLRPYYVNLRDYQKVKKLGQGAFGAVYLATQISTGRQVALKELEPDISDERQRISFQREVSILASGRHPALLTLIGCTPFEGDGGRGPCIITPYMSRGSLDQYIKAEQKSQAAATWDRTRKLIILLGVASGMMFMHDNRMIHRDLKPANVLLDEKMEPKVADFGLSKFVQLGQSKYQTMRGGTAQFMAPELYLDEPYDFKVDVYAFGIMMFMVITGLDPFQDITNQVILARKVMNGERPTIPDWVGDSLRELITRCWHTSPDQRPHFNEIVYRLGEEKILEENDIDIGPFKGYQVNVTPVELQPQTPVRLAQKRKVGGGTIVREKREGLTPIETLRQMADQGDPYACVKYGQKLQKGDGIQADPRAAVAYFQRAADQNDTDGIVWLAKCYQRGIGTNRDIRQAVSLFVKAIERDDPEALDTMGTMLRYANGVNRDQFKAAAFYNKAADAGHVLAQAHYGEMLEEGRGVQEDIAEAVRYYKMSAEQACPEGMFNLADMYHHAKRVPKNLAEAVRLYRLAAQDGIEEASAALCEIYQSGEDEIRPNVEAAAEIAQQSAEREEFLGLVHYAELLESGRGVPRDQAKARQLLAVAHGPRFLTSQNNYGYALEHGKGCQKNPAQAVRYYAIASGHGNMAATYNLATCYEHGVGVPVNMTKALWLYKQAADSGHDSAIFCYAVALRSGDGCKQDHAEALKYFRKAAELHHAASYRMIGLMYEQGEGVPVDYAEASRWYKLSAEKRDPNGMAFLADMYENGKGVALDQGEAARLYRMAAQAGSRMAMTRLAAMYRDGRGVGRSVPEARRLLTRLASTGSAEAITMLADLPSA